MHRINREDYISLIETQYGTSRIDIGDGEGERKTITPNKPIVKVTELYQKLRSLYLKTWFVKDAYKQAIGQAKLYGYDVS